ncbi:unnamed protein product [Rotaria socialis]
MPSRRSCQRKKKRNALFETRPARPVTEEELMQVRFTKKTMDIDESLINTYLKLKNGYHALPPIRIYGHDNHLWSIDNRRLWLMKERGMFKYEGPYTKEHSTSRFIEFETKYASLRGASSNKIKFRRNPKHQCCINAYENGILDEHLADLSNQECVMYRQQKAHQDENKYGRVIYVEEDSSEIHKNAMFSLTEG